MGKQVALEELVASFDSTAREHGAALRSGDAPASRKAAKRIVTLSRAIKAEGDAGKAALLKLIDSDDVSVRLWAAGDLLFLQADVAEAELERIAHGPPGPIRLDAEMTLQEWRAGRFKGR